MNVVNKHLATDPDCITGVLTTTNVIEISQLLQVPTIDRAQHVKQQRIYPNVKFSCTGRITRILFAAAVESLTSSNDEQYAQLQLWKEDVPNQYRKTRTISFSSAVKTEHLSIYEIDNFTTPVTVERGESVGLYLPSQQSSMLMLGFQHSTEDEATNATLGYSSSQYEANNIIFDLRATHVTKDFDIPLIVIQTGECLFTYRRF